MADKAQGSSGTQWQRRPKAMNAPSDGSARALVGPKSTAGISRRVFVGGSAGVALAAGGFSNLLTSSRAGAQTGSGTVVVMAWENYVDPEIQKRSTRRLASRCEVWLRTPIRTCS